MNAEEKAGIRHVDTRFVRDAAVRARAMHFRQQTPSQLLAFISDSLHFGGA